LVGGFHDGLVVRDVVTNGDVQSAVSTEAENEPGWVRLVVRSLLDVLRVGDSLRRKIDAGIARSRFGVVVLSKAFFAKGWAQYELDGLVTMKVSGKQVLLPLWHEISMDEVRGASPTLADTVALRTSDYSIDEIAEEIGAVIRRSSHWASA